MHSFFLSLLKQIRKLWAARDIYICENLPLPPLFFSCPLTGACQKSGWLGTAQWAVNQQGTLGGQQVQPHRTFKHLRFSEHFGMKLHIRAHLFLRFWALTDSEWVSLRCPYESGSKFWLRNTREKVKSNLYNWFKLRNAMYHFFWVTLYMLNIWNNITKF